MSGPIFNFHDALLIVTSYQCLLFVLIYSVKRERHISDYFLIAFFLAQAAIPAHTLINYSEGFSPIALEASPLLFKIFDIAYWIEGPLLLWYTRALLYKDFKFGKPDLLFFIPMLLYVIYIGVTFYSQGFENKISLLAEYKTQQAPSTQHTIIVIREVFRVIFSAVCLYEIHLAQQQIRERYSSIDSINFGWLSFLLIVIIFQQLWALIFALLVIFYPGIESNIFNLLGIGSNYLMFFLISALILFSLTRSRVFDGKIIKKTEPINSENFKIDPEVAFKVEQHMLLEKPYLEHLLNLDQLAEQLEMSPRALSKVIKLHFKTNFYEFINSYRIEKAKGILEDSAQANKKMLQILDECGFNSKASFNSFFKKITGSTPTQYRKKQQA